MTEQSAASEWKTGWLLVFASALGVALGSVQIYSTGVFVEPLEAEFGWSRSSIMGGLLITSMMGVVFSPFFGYLIDRFGARALALPGVAVTCLGFSLLSLAGPEIWTWWALWFVIALGALMTKPTVWSTAVSSHFRKGRGIALAVMLCGTGLGSAAVPPLCYFLIEAFGWRTAYLGVAAIFFVIVAPIMWLFFHDRRKEPLKPGETAKTVSGWTAREGFAKRQFFQLLAAAVVITSVVVGFVAHLVPMLENNGLERETAVYLAGLTGLLSVIGRLSVGYLFDKFSGPPIGAISVLLPLPAAILLLLFPGSFFASLVVVLFLGLAVGGEYDSIIFLASRYFGMRAFGTLFGVTASGLMAGVGLGPLMAGAIFDAYGSYDIFLYLTIAMSFFTALMLGTLGRYPDHA